MTCPSGAFHRELCNAIDAAILPKGRLVGAVPREHAKTTYGTTWNVIRCICLGLKKHIVLVGANKEQAEKKFINIRAELEDNPLLREDFGAGIAPKTSEYTRREKYSMREMSLANGVKIVSIEMRGKLRGLTHRGHRPDLVILDDPEDDDTVESDTERRRQQGWIDKALLNSLDSENGSVIWLGTLLHHDALLTRALNPQSENYKGNWMHLQRDAMDVWDYDAGIPLWPEYWSREKLYAREQDIGRVAMGFEFFNMPVDPEQQIFKPEFWRWYDYGKTIREESGRFFLLDPLSRHKPLELHTYMGVDPAIGQDKRHDFTAIILIGVNQQTRDIYVLDIDRFKINVNQLAERIALAQRRFLPHRTGIESFIFQALLAQQVMDRGLRVVEVKPTGSKKVRIEASAVPFAQGRVYLPEDKAMSKTFTHEAEQFPSGKNDDMLDAWAIAHEVASYRGGPSVATAGRRQMRAERMGRLENW